MSTPKVSRYRVGHVVTEYEYLRPEQKATLLRVCPDLLLAVARLNAEFRASQRRRR